MSTKKFKAVLMAKDIEKALPKFTVFEGDCKYPIEGEIKKFGKVKVLGVMKPTISDYTGGNLPDAEEADGMETFIDIDTSKVFNYFVDDIDKALSHKGLMEALSEETTMGLAEARDSYIAKSIAKSEVKTITLDIANKQDAADAISQAKVYLRGNGVNSKLPVTAYLGNGLYDLVSDYLVSIKTQNDKNVKDGEIEKFKGLKVKETNNLYKDEEGYFNAVVKTSKAYAFAAAIDEVEAYRPEKRMCDAIKGLNCFGGKVIRPKEIVVIRYKLG